MGERRNFLTRAFDYAPRELRILWNKSTLNIWKIASITAVATTIGIAIADRPEPPPPPVPEKPYRQDSWKRDYPRPPHNAQEKEQLQPAPTPEPASQQVAQPAPAVAPVVVPAPVPPPSPTLKAPMQFRQPAASGEKIKPRDLGNFRVVN